MQVISHITLRALALHTLLPFLLLLHTVLAFVRMSVNGSWLDFWLFASFALLDSLSTLVSRSFVVKEGIACLTAVFGKCYGAHID